MLHNSACVRIDVLVEEDQVLTLLSRDRRTIFQPCSMTLMSVFEGHTAVASGETEDLRTVAKLTFQWRSAHSGIQLPNIE
jgi:hypothetical protein